MGGEGELATGSPDCPGAAVAAHVSTRTLPLCRRYLPGTAPSATRTTLHHAWSASGAARPNPEQRQLPVLAVRLGLAAPSRAAPVPQHPSPRTQVLRQPKERPHPSLFFMRSVTPSCSHVASPRCVLQNIHALSPFPHSLASLLTALAYVCFQPKIGWCLCDAVWREGSRQHAYS